MNQFRYLMRVSLSLALALVILPTAPANANTVPTLQGRIVQVIDGDTVTLQTESRHVKIRLAGIDAPESKMPYGAEAQAQLAAMVLGQEVQALVQKKDRYGRTIATLILNTKDVNLAMVQAGMAWHYKQYEQEQSASDAAAYAHMETRARSQGVGLWQVELPTPPWEWRHARRTTMKTMEPQ